MYSIVGISTYVPQVYTWCLSHSPHRSKVDLKVIVSLLSGAIAIGITSDILRGRAIACVGMLLLEIPMVRWKLPMKDVHIPYVCMCM